MLGFLNIFCLVGVFFVVFFFPIFLLLGFLIFIYSVGKVKSLVPVNSLMGNVKSLVHSLVYSKFLLIAFFSSG